MTREEAINRIVSEFNLTTELGNGKSFYVPEEDNCAVFYFDKREHWRHEVISKLASMFSDVNIIDGQCRIDPITLLWTTVYIEKRS